MGYGGLLYRKQKNNQKTHSRIHITRTHKTTKPVCYVYQLDPQSISQTFPR